MAMKQISIEEVKTIADQYGLKACKVKGSDVVNIRKNPTNRQEDISWEEFEETLNRRGLAVFKAENSDFLKIQRIK